MYITLAQVYDRLMQDIDYEAMADQVARLFAAYGVHPGLVLDLGCGTGSLALAMAARGHDMIGIDLSPDMLDQAARKAADAGAGLLLLQQDIRSFDLYGTVGAVLASLDVLNHITDRRGLKSVFRRVHTFLEPGGLFLFDLNSPWKLSSSLPGQTFYHVDEDVTWLWTNSYDRRRSVCTFDLTFFLADGEGRYVREDEMHEERAWREAEIREMLAGAGLDLLAVRDGYTERRPGPHSERLLYVVRRP